MKVSFKKISKAVAVNKIVKGGVGGIIVCCISNTTK
mgnify:CR=1 FL=1